MATVHVNSKINKSQFVGSAAVGIGGVVRGGEGRGVVGVVEVFKKSYHSNSQQSIQFNFLLFFDSCIL